MRNYFKMLSMLWYDSDGVAQFAWGADDDDLMKYVVRMETWAKLFNPNLTFQRTPPQVCYFELDKKNFAQLLNLNPNSSAFDIWVRTHLRIPPFTINQFPLENLYDMTRVIEEGSPRPLFPTTQGTDGQRLRRGIGRTTRGNVLNYLARLYFYTSKTVFLDLWKLLKKGKITAKIALERAAVLVFKR